jgi:hypothetical protein
MVDGNNLPIDVWTSGFLTLRSDSTYLMEINGSDYETGRWTTHDNQIVVSSTREAVWVGFIQPHALLFPTDAVHFNNFLFQP